MQICFLSHLPTHHSTPTCIVSTDQFATQTCFNGRYGDEIGSDQFGATVMIFGKSPDQDLVTGRIEYVEVTEAGQVRSCKGVGGQVRSCWDAFD